MKPIISPIWFYLVNLFSKVEILTEALITLGVILTVILAIIIISVEVDCGFVSEKERKKWYGYLKKVLLLPLLQELCIVQFHQKVLVIR